MIKRKTMKIPRYPGIYRNLVWDSKVRKWKEPSRGHKFQATVPKKLPNGKYGKIKKSFSSFEEAKAFRFNQQEEISNHSQRHLSDSILFKELVEKWVLVHFSSLEVSTANRYKSYLKHFWFFYEMPVEKIKPTMIDEWICHMKTDEYLALGNPTRCDYKHEYSVLRSILKFYKERYSRTYNLPFLDSHRKMLKVRENPKPKKDLSVEEFCGFLSALDRDVSGTRYECLSFLARLQYATYSRTQEATALCVEDFDLQKMTVTINKKIVWPRARDQKPFVRDGLKASSTKVIPLSEFAAKSFKQWLVKSGIRSGPLFLFDGEIPEYRRIEYRYSKSLKAAGLPFSATYILRHASLSECYSRTGNILATRDFAGHTDLKSTQRYAKARDETLKNAQEMMDLGLKELPVAEF